MLHFYDRATMARALTLDLEPQLTRLMTDRITLLPHDLIDWTEYLVVETDDTEADIIRAVGFSPLIEPIDGIRFGQPGFHPFWDWLVDHGGWWEMVVTFGGAFAYVLLIDQRRHEPRELYNLCKRYASGAC